MYVLVLITGGLFSFGWLALMLRDVDRAGIGRGGWRVLSVILLGGLGLHILLFVLVGNQPFLGGMRLRLQPSGLDHYADLFSAAYIRWNLNGRFATVHANPDPLQFLSGKFYYSMPIFPVAEYGCVLSLFNPYDDASVGRIRIVDAHAEILHEQQYKLDAHSSTLVSMYTGALGTKPNDIFGTLSSTKSIGKGANVIIENDQSAPKSFAYMMVSNKNGELFSTEHPLYQGEYKILYGNNNIVYLSRLSRSASTRPYLNSSRALSWCSKTNLITFVSKNCGSASARLNGFVI